MAPKHARAPLGHAPVGDGVLVHVLAPSLLADALLAHAQMLVFRAYSIRYEEIFNRQLAAYCHPAFPFDPLTARIIFGLRDQ